VMYWLAIVRESVSFLELKEDIVSPSSQDLLSSTLQSLQRKIPLEKNEIRFTLQPVLIEYITDRFIERISDEIRIKEMVLFNNHALIKALAKDFNLYKSKYGYYAACFKSIS
jgi:hypothetical protein